MRPIKYDAIHNDMRLMEMALYETTKGQTQHSSQEVLVKKIAEYKAIIKRGTFTLDELEDKIFSRYGIVNERSRIDTAMYDASMEMLGDPSGLFGNLFRKSQGLPNTPPVPPADETNSLEGLDLDDLDDLDEFDDDFEQGQLDEDFPIDPNNSNEEPEDDDDLPF